MSTDEYLTFCYEWNVKLEDIVDKKFNDMIYSPSFLTSHNGVFHEWKLRLRPAGSISGGSIEIKDFLGIWVGLLGVNKTVRIKLGSVCFYEVDGITHSFGGTGRVHELKACDDLFFGYTRAIKLEQKNGDYVLPFTCKDIKLYWKFGIDKNAFKKDHSLPIPLPPSQGSTIELLYGSTKENPRSPTVDATLVSKDGVKLHAHSCVLATFSDVFKGMFYSDLDQDQKSKEIVIDDIEGVGLQELIHFAYFTAPSGDIKDNVEPALKAADKYLVKGLVDVCERVMVQKLYENETDLCVHCFCVAKLYRLEILEQRATAMLLNHWLEISTLSKRELDPYIWELSDKFARLVHCSKVPSA